MSKSTRRARRRQVKPSGSLQTASPLLERILSTPELAQVVPRLPPDVLHRVIQHYGLEDCAELIALATPDQVAQVFDLDLWRARPGRDEQFDPERFGAWLEVMVDAGAAAAATTLAAVDADLVSTALAQHVRVFDYAVTAPFISLDGDVVSSRHAADGGLRCEVGGYTIVAKRAESWDAITAVLAALDEAHGDYLRRVMGRCRRLSNSRPEEDGLNALADVSEQAMFDVAVDREGRRESQGYVSAAQARAFLETARRIDLGRGVRCPDNAIARAHFRDAAAHQVVRSSSEIVSLPASHEAPGTSPESIDAAAAVVELLHEAGVLSRQPRALLDAPRDQVPRLARIHAQLRFLHEHDPDAYEIRNGELAYLANALIAGASIQARTLSATEASNAAAAVCNLGLENWPAQWLAGDSGADLPADFLIQHDLVAVFQVGWTTLHENVCMYAAEQLVGILGSMSCEDRETREALDALRITMTKQLRSGTPWRARDALDVIAMLDAPSWAALLGLIDECPVLHAAVSASLTGARAVSASAFEFIADNRQISTVREFMQLLPDRL